MVFEKGRMRYFKKALGVILGLYLINAFYTLSFLDKIPIPYVREIALGFAIYFLLISGRQQ